MSVGNPDLMDVEHAAGHATHPWFRILLGASIFLVAILACVILFGHYLDNRPTNLCDITAAAATHLEQSLVSAGIPATDIQRSEPRLRNEDDVAWYSYNVTINAKQPLTKASINNLLQRDLPRATVTELPQGEHEQRFSVTMDGHEFAVLEARQQPDTTDMTPACSAIAADIAAFLTAQGIPDETVKRSDTEPKQENALRWSRAHFEATVPLGRSFEQIESALRSALAPHAARLSTRLGIRGTTTLVVALQGQVCAEVVLSRGNDALNEEPRFRLADLDAPELKIEKGVEMPDFEEMPPDSPDIDNLALGLKLNLNNPIPPAEHKRPRVAIIVDDSGFCGPVKDKILALDSHLTLAIMPEGPCAGEVARRGKEAGFEIMLHLTMQGTNKPEGLTPNMSAAQIRKITEEGFAKIPGAVGVNNHMGSIFTAHEDVVKIFVDYIKQRGNLFIIDSVTTSKTKLLATARKAGVPSASRDVFLDMDKDSSRIPIRFNELMKIAKKRGQAIAIGHFHEKTAKVLAEMLPELEKNGIELVHVSELVH